MLQKDENRIPKILLKEIQKERVENAMKSGGQRVAIDFTVSDDMRNKVSTFFNHLFRLLPRLNYFLVYWWTDWRTDGRTDEPTIDWLIEWLQWFDDFMAVFPIVTPFISRK